MRPPEAPKGGECGAATSLGRTSPPSMAAGRTSPTVARSGREARKGCSRRHGPQTSPRDVRSTSAISASSGAGGAESTTAVDSRAASSRSKSLTSQTIAAGT